MIVTALIWLSAASVGTDTTNKDDDPVICRREQSEVGTHMRPKKTCLKKSEWDFIEDHTRNKLQSINQRGNNPGRADKPR
jgi:hypothetical protein